MLNALVLFLLALLAGAGVGSAGLPVLWLTLSMDLPQLEAQVLALLFFVFSSGTALLVHLFHIPLPAFTLLMIPFGLLGAWCGVALATTLPTEILRTVFGLFLILTGAVGLFRKEKK